LQSSEVDDERVAEAVDKDDRQECVEASGSPAASEGDSALPASNCDSAVATCEHSEQLLICGSTELMAENAATGEMRLPVQALVKRGKKSDREDLAVRYPPITGTLSQRCVQSIEHIVQVFCFLASVFCHMCHTKILKTTLMCCCVKEGTIH